MSNLRKTTAAACILAAGVALGGCVSDRTEWVDGPPTRAGRTYYREGPARYVEAPRVYRERPARYVEEPRRVRERPVRYVEQPRRVQQAAPRPAATQAPAPAPRDAYIPDGGGSGGGGGGGSGGGGGGWSDRRLKRNIVRLGTSPSGLPIYAFDYVWGGPRHVGVMAQDLLQVRPEAVIATGSGYLMVDYDMIDVRMTTYEDWLAARVPA